MVALLEKEGGDPDQATGITGTAAATSTAANITAATTEVAVRWAVSKWANIGHLHLIEGRKDHPSADDQ
jgi:hypothetical protein